jgi:hypothetical protein
LRSPFARFPVFAASWPFSSLSFSHAYPSSLDLIHWFSAFKFWSSAGSFHVRGSSKLAPAAQLFTYEDLALVFFFLVSRSVRLSFCHFHIDPALVRERWTPKVIRGSPAVSSL